jgi:ATP-dependent Clp protease adaptor protein ClpS
MAGPVASTPTATPEAEQVEFTESHVDPDRPWVTVVWNDPVNLMSYVTHVFMAVFGYSKQKSTRLMLDVHHKGKAIVSSGPRERMEGDTAALHGYGLWATIQRDS